MFVDGVQTSESTRSPDVESWWEWNSRGILPMFDFTVVGDKKVATFSVESAEIVQGKSQETFVTLVEWTLVGRDVISLIRICPSCQLKISWPGFGSITMVTLGLANRGDGILNGDSI